MALSITGLLMVLVLLVRWVYLPVIGQIRERRVAVQDLRVKIADAKELLPKLPAQEAAFQQAKQRFETLQIRLGNAQALANILDTLRTQAERLHLEFSATQLPYEEEAQGVIRLGAGLALREVPVTLTLIGRYRNLGELLGSLAEAPVVGAIDTLSVGSKPEFQPRLEANVSLKMWLAGNPSQ